MRIVLVLGLFFNLLFANEHLESVYENIVLKNSFSAVQSAEKLQDDLKNNRFENLSSDFKELVHSWKSVQSFYVLGDMDENYLDTPRYIDTFHHGNEDIKVQLDRILKADDELSISLYKNSHKTINALEYILFTKDMKNQRVKDVALIIIKTIKQNLQDIYDGYKRVQNDFVNDEQKANAVMLNSLIENSYKLKEWRIGDPSGLSRKYKGDPNNERGEYFLSKNSTLAIKAVLDTHLDILDKRGHKNFGSLIKSYEINDELKEAVGYLKESLSKLKNIKNDDFSNAKPLYKAVRKVHATYYITLIGKLKVTAKVLDADGD